jgi:hypothetical protein
MPENYGIRLGIRMPRRFVLFGITADAFPHCAQSRLVGPDQQNNPLC